MSRWHNPEPHEYELHDDGRLVIRRLGTRRYMGLRLPEFRSVPGDSVHRVLEKYDLWVRVEHLRAAGMGDGTNTEYKPLGFADLREAELKLQCEWLRRAWK